MIHSLETLEASAWNGLAGTSHPFLRYEFLSALERYHCVGEHSGWIPHHLCVFDRDRLVAATPSYLKNDSWGEFVFDFAWAHAYARSGRRYYPKLVTAVPFSPVLGPRLLHRPEEDATTAARWLADGLRAEAKRLDLSSVHCLFPEERERRLWTDRGYRLRRGYQFHWRNAGYTRFDDFLDALTSKKRKNIRRERRKVADAGVRFRWLDGTETTASDWDIFYQFYERTFRLYGNIPRLAPGFFRDIAAQLPTQVLLLRADDASGPLAAALFLRGQDALYGRYWGARTDRDSLHFETCYYQAIDFCIHHEISSFEPGVQGEHKLARGFLPTVTESAHWIADPAFRDAVDDFLERERVIVDDHIHSLCDHSPYRQEIVDRSEDGELD